MKKVVYQNIEFSVSENGEIYRKGKLCKTTDNGNGYRRVYGSYSSLYAHRLVCMAYHGIPETKMEVNHKNGDKADNRPENLEWCKRSYNIKHSFWVLNRKRSRALLGKSGFDHPLSKPINQIDKNTGEFIRTFGSVPEAAAAMGVTKNAICSTLNKPNRTSCGYRWTYSDEKNKYRQKENDLS